MPTYKIFVPNIMYTQYQPIKSSFFTLQTDRFWGIVISKMPYVSLKDMETTNLDIRLVLYLLACSFLNGRSWYNFSIIPKIVIEKNCLLVPVVMVEICGDHFERKYIVSNSKNTLSTETFFSIMWHYVS